MYGIFWHSQDVGFLGTVVVGGLGNWIEKINWGKAVEGTVSRILRIISCSLGRGLRWHYGRWVVVERYYRQRGHLHSSCSSPGKT